MSSHTLPLVPWESVSIRETTNAPLVLGPLFRRRFQEVRFLFSSQGQMKQKTPTSPGDEGVEEESEI